MVVFGGGGLEELQPISVQYCSINIASLWLGYQNMRLRWGNGLVSGFVNDSIPRWWRYFTSIKCRVTRWWSCTKTGQTWSYLPGLEGELSWESLSGKDAVRPWRRSTCSIYYWFSMVYIAICVSMYPHPLFIQPQPKIFQMFSDMPNPQEYPGDCLNCGNPLGIQQVQKRLRRSWVCPTTDISRPGISTKATTKTEVTWGWNREGGRGVQGVVMLQVRCKGCVSWLNLRGLYPDLGMVIPVIPPSSSIHTNYHGQY